MKIDWFGTKGNQLVVLTILVLLFANPVPASQDSVRCVQQQLNALGFSVGSVDGVLGKKSRRAASSFAEQNPSNSLPDLEARTASTWCVEIAKLHPDLPKPEIFIFQFGDDVDQETREMVRKAAQKSQVFYSTYLGVSVPIGTKVTVSADARFLAKKYVELKNVPRYYKQSVRNWTDKRNAEGGYGGIFIRTNTQSFEYALRDSTGKRIQRMMRHELFHAIQYGLVGPRAKRCCNGNDLAVVGPVWLIEGSARYLEHGLKGPGNRRIIAGRNEQLQGEISVSKLETRAGVSKFDRSYAISAMMVDKLVKSSDVRALPSFWIELGNGKNWKTSFKSAFGIKPKDFYSQF